MTIERIRYRGVRRQLGALNCVMIEPAEPTEIQKLIVLCHGFGASGEDLVGIAEELLRNMSDSAAVKLLFPAGPLSLDEQGLPGGRAWWLLSIQQLIDALEQGRYEQIREAVPAGIDAAREKLVETIGLALSECQLTEQQLVLGGFSQGAMLSVDVACRGLTEPPAALCLYSGALICEKIWSRQAARLSACRILQSHGRMDPVLPFQTGIWLHDMLVQAGCQVDFIEFNGPHTIPMQAVERTAHLVEAT